MFRVAGVHLALARAPLCIPSDYFRLLVYIIAWTDKHDKHKQLEL